MTSAEPWSAVVVAGGSGMQSRGVDTVTVAVALLQRVVAASAVVQSVIVVGPRREMTRPCGGLWAREEPSGGGPLAGFGAG